STATPTPAAGAPPVGATPEPSQRPATSTPRQRLRSSINVRILGAFVLLMATATLLSVVLVRQALLTGLDDRIDADLVLESRELRRLAEDGSDPETGEPFGTHVRRIFEVFLERNVPARGEAFLTFVGGELYLRSRNVLPYRLDEDEALVARWSGLTETAAGSVATRGGTVRYLAVPMRAGGETRGVFVAAVFRDIEAEQLDPAVRAGALVGLAELVIGSLLAFVVARRIITSVQAVEGTARTISESDLSRRIEVRGDDEIAHLAGTFNELLDRLEQAFTAQRAFVDDAGHELRTPITIIRGQLETLGDDPEQRQHAIDLVTDELDRMSRMVNDLLLLAKAHQPEFLEFDLVDVASLTREVHEKAEALGERRWVLDRVAEGAVVGDRQRLQQAMIQLAQNAVEHTDPGVEIGVGSLIEDGRARLWVRDTGPGIPPDEHDRIFERFARSGSRRSEGAGLGLAIVRVIAEGHGGRVEIQSEVGTGATFSIEVPVDQDPAGSDMA
ncbi:MAG: sensor histidine kinase, partial [Actinomycetota bacterium]